ncbi:radical SAM protein [Desulfolucanica intricata]|uniref:radical SAM protein n=1 Tax=Desulfolucanica intricata TaxID=1285191 RepID=UPI000830E622|nr:radical SAM protein [Desulfolucanica intricata]
MKIGIKLSSEELKNLQVLSSTHLAISITEQCSLKCSHCIVGSGGGGQNRSGLTAEMTRSIARELKVLRQRGVRKISFTGGEPLLAGETLHTLSQAACENDIKTTVVTSAFFAGTLDDSYKEMKKYPFISEWHISSDIFHQKYVSIDNVVNAAQTALMLERKALVRMAAAKPAADADIAHYNWLKNNLPQGVGIIVQPVIKSGRAGELNLSIKTAKVPGWPCITNGMTVRVDGTVSPCCAGLVAVKTGHPFIYENIFAAGLVQVYDSWCEDPLLKLIQAVGFMPLLAWINQSIPEHPVLQAVPEHPCECCLAIWKHPEAAAVIQNRLRAPGVIEKINQLYEVVFK